MDTWIRNDEKRNTEPMKIGTECFSFASTLGKSLLSTIPHPGL